MEDIPSATKIVVFQNNWYLRTGEFYKNHRDVIVISPKTGDSHKKSLNRFV